ncbi:MAG: ACT domain-containing protein [Chthoniobacterales bacterium]
MNRPYLELAGPNLLIVITARERHFVGMGEKPKIKIESVTQLAVFLSNRPGALARVCEELAGAKINIHALSISDTADHSVVRMVVSDPTKALMLLGERGVLALETEVLMIETENHPGALGRIAERLAEAEVNIEYAYMAATLNSPNGLMILRPDDVEKAHKVVGNL